MTIAFLFAAAALTTGPADVQAVPRSAPQESIDNRQSRGQPATVAKKRGTRCRIVKRAGQDKHVCSKAPVRR